MVRISIVLAGIFMLVSTPALWSQSTLPGGGTGSERVGVPTVKQIGIAGTRSGDEMVNAKIEPFNKYSVNRETRILWNNNSDTPVRIIFMMGHAPSESKLSGPEKCKNISEALPRTQYWSSGRCYVTGEPIPPGGSLEILFDEQGRYSYRIEYVGTSATESGLLEVF